VGEGGEVADFCPQSRSSPPNCGICDTAD